MNDRFRKVVAVTSFAAAALAMAQSAVAQVVPGACGSDPHIVCAVYDPTESYQIAYRPGEATVIEAHHPHRLVERQRIAGTGAIAVGRHHRHFTEFRQTFGEHKDAGCIHTVVIAQQNPHAAEPRGLSCTALKFSRSDSCHAADQSLEAGAAMEAADAGAALAAGDGALLVAPAGPVTT